MRRHDLTNLNVGGHDKLIVNTGLGRLEDQPEPVTKYIISYRYSQVQYEYNKEVGGWVSQSNKPLNSRLGKTVSGRKRLL